jgi:DNA (cytosine-5)-methyltransferase 1
MRAPACYRSRVVDRTEDARKDLQSSPAPHLAELTGKASSAVDRGRVILLAHRNDAPNKKACPPLEFLRVMAMLAVMSRKTTRKPTPSRAKAKPKRHDVLAWVLTARRSAEPDRSPLRIADVFCGCGGLTLGVQEAARRVGRKIEIRLAVDLDPAATAVYLANFPKVADRLLQGDVTTLFDGENGTQLTPVEEKIRDGCGAIDALIAGPPCQGHSNLNNSTRRDDPRNLLYLRAVRAVEVLRPPIAVLENVPSVVHDKAGVVEKATKTLERLGYHVSSMVVDVRSLGLPQRRRRHVLLATTAKGVTIKGLLPLDKPANISIGPFIRGLEDEPDRSTSLVARPARITTANAKRVKYLFDKQLYDLPDSARPPCHRDKVHSYQSVYGRLRWDCSSQTITSGFGSMGQGRYVHPKRQRLITPHEAARIQGFPDFFDFSASGGVTALRTMIGNAVPPPLMIALFGAILNSISRPQQNGGPVN